MAKRILWVSLALVALWIGLGLVSQLGAQILWFRTVNYLPVFWVRLSTKIAIAVGVFTVCIVFLMGNLLIANRLRYRHVTSPEVKAAASGRSLPLVGLLVLALSLILLIDLLVLHYGEAVLERWAVDLPLPNVTPTLPTPFHPQSAWRDIVNWLIADPAQYWLILRWVGIGASAIAILLFPRLVLAIAALAMSASLSFVLMSHWGKVLQFFHPIRFGQTDPLFERDISFYIFALPIQELLQFWLTGIAALALASVVLVYLLSGNSLSEGRFPGFSLRQKQHLHSLTGAWMLTLALGFWVSRYKLLYSPRGVAFGASYTDVHAQLPAYTALSILAALVALWFFWRAAWLTERLQLKVPKSLAHARSPSLKVLIVYFTVAAIASYLIPDTVQRLVVQPNELTRERPYIARAIAFTREAFGLNDITSESFNPSYQLTYQDLLDNTLTIRNIRLWDTRPLLQTNRQLQQIRPYYKFADADIDRYTLADDDSATKQQVLISARELDTNDIPTDARTWLNEHLVYTHGYGFTMSPVNKVAAGGLPDYFVRDIGTGPDGGLTVSSPSIRASIPIGRPRLYFGELTNTYIMTNTRVQEFDYPSGEENVYTTYGGTGGITIGNSWRKWLFARYLRDWQMLFTDNFTDGTRLLFRRNINERIRAIAPFLQYDRDPYLVVANATPGQPSADSNYLYWMIDAYTTSDRYPYSDSSALAVEKGERDRATGKSFNYIRNSVKAVIDAYNGTITFYVADLEDPLIRSWATIFPSMFRPLSDMPVTFRTHIRYPADLFSVQSERLLTYHMTDPQVFYNREDLWQVPTEIYGNQPQPVEPYYLITRLPGEANEEFITVLMYTPNQRRNLIAWLAARSDGENYGKALLYTFPKQELVYGIEQIEARINQDPVISQQISLWNRQGSRAVQGNLLVIPIQESLLYVEPLYLEAEQNSLPTLARVIVAYEDRIVMAKTLETALQNIFQPSGDAQPPAIVRPVGEPTPEDSVPTPTPTPTPPE